MSTLGSTEASRMAIITCSPWSRKSGNFKKFPHTVGLRNVSSEYLPPGQKNSLVMTMLRIAFEFR